MFKEIPVWENGQWGVQEFSTRDEFKSFVESLFKEPGKYEFDESSSVFTEQAVLFRKQGFYCEFPIRSKDYVNYWDDQKKKCRNGIIVKNNGKTWYLTREYYMWLNFLPINDKEQKKFDFPQVRDAQYHMALYEMLAELHYKHAAILKKRQIASSYFHCAKMINLIWFEETPIIKMGAALKDYINDKGSWKFLSEYRSFLDEHTAWYRPMTPAKVLMWQQQIEETVNGRKHMRGLKGVLQGVTFEKDPTSGVGGPCHRLGTLIVMHDGRFKKVEDIKVGDYVLGIDNLPKRVNKTFVGLDLIYRVEQARGHDYYTTGEHLLYLINRDKEVAPENKKRLIKTKDWESLTDYQKRCYVGVKNKKILEFHNQSSKPTLDPYFLGLWLGDGYREVPGIIVNKTKDPEILEYLEKLAADKHVSINIRRKEQLRYQMEMYTVRFPISEDGVNTCFTDDFIKYNLFYNKHIPDEFLYGSAETRLQVLAGLIDTDGYYDPAKGHFELSCKNDKLSKQIAFLCRSLGAYVKERRVSSAEHSVNGRLIKYSETNVLGIRFQDPFIIPTKVKRKQPDRNLIRKRNIHTSPIKSVIKIGYEGYAGIEVDDHLYYLEDLTITHNCTLFFYEEAGIAPSMDITVEFLFPAMRSGHITTGIFIAAGSVGDLDQCDPLKQMILYPDSNDIYAITTNLLDDKGSVSKTGLFIPEQWSMPPYIDKYGNSMVEEALAAIMAEREQWKRDLSPEKYQYRISQHPINIDEAFANRKLSKFPLNLVASQINRIQDKEYPYELLELYKNENGKIEAKDTRKLPISEFPITKNTEDKTGSIVVWERPAADPEFGMYYASIDPVSEGKTTTSESLCSIYVYKTAVEVTRINTGGETETYIEKDKIVAAWCGRFDDLNKTHERLEIMIEWYNAWTVVENNISLFIQHMINRKKQRYLVPKSQILFLKDLGANNNVFQEYGWKNTGTIFRSHLLSYLIEFLKEEIDIETKSDGSIVKTTYGIERIPDIMAMREMQAYTDDLNVDRLVALAALIAFAKVQQANRGYKKKVERLNGNKLEKSENLFKLNKGGMFRHIGKPRGIPGMSKSRSPFKNIK